MPAALPGSHTETLHLKRSRDHHPEQAALRPAGSFPDRPQGGKPNPEDQQKTGISLEMRD